MSFGDREVPGRGPDGVEVPGRGPDGIGGELDGSGWSLPGYEIGSVLGRGGFATVYRARQLSLGRDVAIKVLSADMATPADRRRFDRERQSLVSLSGHPHVVDVLDAGVTPERHPYLVMRLYRGGALIDRIARHGPLPPAETVDVVTKIASALDAAHALGILHRDVKPENVLVAEDGRPVLADFGIAGMVRPDVLRTHLSTTFFTLAHAAPEILERQSYGVASDVYALASTAYQLLTGRRAFDPTNPRVTSQILDDPPAPVTEPWVPIAMAEVVTAAMAKDPTARPTSAGSFAAALAAALTPPGSRPAWSGGSGCGGAAASGSGCGGAAASGGAPASGGAADPAPRRRTVLTAFLLSGGTVVASGAYYIRATRRSGGATTRPGGSTVTASSPPVSAPITLGTGRLPTPAADAERGDEVIQLAGHDDTVQALAWAPRGGLLASVSGDRTARVWDPVVGGTLWTLTGHSHRVGSVAWARDGRMLATASDDGTARIWDAGLGRCVRVLNGAGSPTGGVTWSPDGRALATGGDAVRIWDPATGKVIQTFTTGTTTEVAWSPDGRSLATSNTDHTVRIWDVVGGSLRQVLFGHAAPTTPVVWSPDGRSLGTLPDDLSARTWDPATGRVRYTLADPHRTARSLAWSPDGSKVAVGGDGIGIWSAARGQLLYVLDKIMNVMVLAWAPDGRTLATSGDDDSVRIWVA
jgi:WD40 repeat protein